MPTMIETAASALERFSSLLWLLMAIVVVAIGVTFPTPAAANPVVAETLPSEIMFATCHFADSSLIVIEKKLNQLFIRLSDGQHSHEENEEDRQKEKWPLAVTFEKEGKKKEAKDAETSIEHLNSTYRSLVNRFAKVSDEESPLPALSRMRRQIRETLNSVPRHYASVGTAFGNRPLVLDAADELENDVEIDFAPSTTTCAPSTAASTGFPPVVNLPTKWHSMIVTCLEHYRILKRIILFERFLRCQQDREQQANVKKMLMLQLNKTLKQNQLQQPTPGWHQKMICKMSRRLVNLSATLKLYTVCLLANKVLIAGFAALIMLIFVLNCFRFSVEELMFHK